MRPYMKPEMFVSGEGVWFRCLGSAPGSYRSLSDNVFLDTRNALKPYELQPKLLKGGYIREIYRGVS